MIFYLGLKNSKIINKKIFFIFFSRPKTVDEICYQEEVVNALKKSLETKNVINYLLLIIIIKKVTTFTFLWTTRNR